jgi:hypothetical protein
LENVFLLCTSICFISICSFVLWQVEKPVPVNKDKRQFVFTSQLFQKKECSQDEKRIASLFSADTLPGLMQKGLIQKYQRNVSGTCILVNGHFWKERSKYFKNSLLTEVFVYNKVNGYEFSTKIIDGLSGKLYAQILTSAKIDFYN